MKESCGGGQCGARNLWGSEIPSPPAHGTISTYIVTASRAARVDHSATDEPPPSPARVYPARLVALPF